MMDRREIEAVFREVEGDGVWAVRELDNLQGPGRVIIKSPIACGHPSSHTMSIHALPLPTPPPHAHYTTPFISHTHLLKLYII
jgi:hypothetical protein